MVQWLKSNRRRHRGYGEMDDSGLFPVCFFIVIVIVIVRIRYPVSLQKDSVPLVPA